MHGPTLITVLIVLPAAAVLVVPLVGEEQQAANITRIGLLSPTSPPDSRNLAAELFRFFASDPGCTVSNWDDHQPRTPGRKPDRPILDGA
jgi:hypothetical protein